MNELGPYFHAWCTQETRLDALTSGLASIVGVGKHCNITIEQIGHPTARRYTELTLEGAIATVRSEFRAGTHIEADCGFSLRTVPELCLCLDCFGEQFHRPYSSGALVGARCDRSDLLPRFADVVEGAGSAHVEAAAAAIQVQHDIEDLTRHLFASHTKPGRLSGICTWDRAWGDSLQACVIYQSDVSEIARPLALSWLHAHLGEEIDLHGDLSIELLRTRIEAPPNDASSVAKRDAYLSRGAVLRALDAPPGDLFRALEAAAVPDDEWFSVEAEALDMIEAKNQGAPTYGVNIAIGQRARFIEQHAPYRVRRLPSGGVLLATHPYRTLWPLWQDALFLLGIAP